MHIHFIQHVAFEYPGSLIAWARDNNHTTGFTKIFERPEFPAPDQFDMLVVMGGPMGVYEEEEFSWISAEKKCILSAIAADKKVLGICLGCQLIASVLGATVYPHTHPEIGWWPVQKTADHFLTASLPNLFTSFHLHGDTFSLPPGAQLLFSTKGCEQQGFVYKNNTAAIQFHPEIDTGLLQNMIDHEKESLIPATYVQAEDEIRKQAVKQLPLQPAYLALFLENFVKG